MNENEVLGRVSESLTDTPDIIKVQVKPKNRLHRWLIGRGLLPRFRTYSMYQLRYANCVRISKALLNIPEGAILLGSDRTQRQVLQLMVDHAETFIRVAAICLTNARKEPPESLLETIRYEFTDEEIMSICRLAVKRLHPSDFIHSIILISGLDVLKQRDENQVSLYTGETIALGDSSEQQPDTLKDGPLTS